MIDEEIRKVFKEIFGEKSLVRIFNIFIIVHTKNPSFENSKLKKRMEKMGLDCEFEEIMKTTEGDDFLLAFSCDRL